MNRAKFTAIATVVTMFLVGCGGEMCLTNIKTRAGTKIEFGKKSKVNSVEPNGELNFTFGKCSSDAHSERQSGNLDAGSSNEKDKEKTPDAGTPGDSKDASAETSENPEETNAE